MSDSPKYDVPDGHWDDDPDSESTESGAEVTVQHHMLTINDESDEIDRYNGIQWDFLFEDGIIVACEMSHYCPGPGHTDPMGFRAWTDVPDRVQRCVLDELNAANAADIVDIDATEDVAERHRPAWKEVPVGQCGVCGGDVYEDEVSDGGDFVHPDCRGGEQ